MNKKVALLIPTKNRTQFLLSVLRYYSNQDSPPKLYICDSSNSNASRKLKEKIKKEKFNLEINFFSKNKFNERQAIGFLLKKCKTEFCAFSGDDDFFLPSGLASCAKFLKVNPNYRIAQGLGTVFHLTGRVDCEWHGFLEDYWGKPCCEELNVTKRVKKYAKNYWVPLFSVHRTQEFLTDWGDNSNNPSCSFGEYQPNFTTILRGRAKFINVPYFIRINHIHRNTLPKTPFGIITKDNWNAGLNKFVDEISRILRALKNSHKRSVALANELARTTFDAWMKNHYCCSELAGQLKESNATKFLYSKIKVKIRKIPFFEKLNRKIKYQKFNEVLKIIKNQNKICKEKTI